MVKDKPSVWQRLTGAFRLKEQDTSTTEITPLQINNLPMGSYGTQVYGGYISEEYLHTLRGRQRADTYDQMRRGDPQVKMCLSSVKNPIKSATWEVEPADDSDDAKSDAEFIHHILFNDLGQPFVDFLSEALTMIDFGHSVFEVIHKVVINNKQFGSYNGIKSLAFRSQRTIERWNLVPETGELKSISQYAFGDIGKVVDIPAENLLIFSIEKEGANYEGVSMLRPCFGPWFRKNNYLKLNAIGIEKFAVPTPLFEVPEGKENSSQYGMMIQVLEHYLTHQKNYLGYPAGWKVDLRTNTYDPSKVETSIDNEDTRMTKAFLANFLELGTGKSSGSYALSNDLSDFFLSGLDQVAGKIAEVINQQLIPQLILLNRGPREKYPVLKASGISDKAGKELADVIQALAGSKVIIPDNQLETHIRKRYGLPKASLEGQRIEVAPAPPGGAPAPAPSPQAPTLAERIRAAEARRLVLSK
jgi:phage gp29-like protein